MRAAVFLDRDDTLIVNRELTGASPFPGSLFDPALVRLAPGSAEACTRFKRAGFALVVVTNQGCVARGECSIADVEATNRRVMELVRQSCAVELDGVYYCPFHPRGNVEPYNVEHPWRKPRPGMILAAAEDLRLDLVRSWMIGDAERDIASALRAGIPQSHTIVVGDAPVPEAGHRAPGMREAADILLKG